VQTITCDCDATPAMQLKAMRQKGDKVDVSHYRVNVNKLQARLNMSCDTGKKRGQIKFDGWPKVLLTAFDIINIRPLSARAIMRFPCVQTTNAADIEGIVLLIIIIVVRLEINPSPPIHPESPRLRAYIIWTRVECETSEFTTRYSKKKNEITSFVRFR